MCKYKSADWVRLSQKRESLSILSQTPFLRLTKIPHVISGFTMQDTFYSSLKLFSSCPLNKRETLHQQWNSEYRNEISPPVQRIYHWNPFWNCIKAYLMSHQMSLDSVHEGEYSRHLDHYVRCRTSQKTRLRSEFFCEAFNSF